MRSVRDRAARQAIPWGAAHGKALVGTHAKNRVLRQNWQKLANRLSGARGVVHANSRTRAPPARGTFELIRKGRLGKEIVTGFEPVTIHRLARGACSRFHLGEGPPHRGVPLIPRTILYWAATPVQPPFYKYFLYYQDMS